MVRMYVLAMLPALVVLSLRADTIELKTGERIEGAFKQANSAGVVIEVAGQSITIPLEKVQAIYFGAVVPARTTALSPSQEAMDSLKALRSVTESGIAYRDYSQRVLDAKVKVDRYLTSPATDAAALRTGIALAMRDYEFASRAWSTSFSTAVGTLAVATSVGTALYGDPEISKCPAVKQFLIEMAGKKGKPPNVGVVGLVVGGRPAVIWACASAQVAQAEQLLTATVSPSSPPAQATANVTPEQVAAISDSAEVARGTAVRLANTGQTTLEQAQLIQKGQASICAVVTVPPGAEIEVDGRRAGVAPLAFVVLKRGDTPRQVTIRMSGYKTDEEAVVPDGKAIPIGLALEKQ